MNFEIATIFASLADTHVAANNFLQRSPRHYIRLQLIRKTGRVPTFNFGWGNVDPYETVLIRGFVNDVTYLNMNEFK